VIVVHRSSVSSSWIAGRHTSSADPKTCARRCSGLVGGGYTVRMHVTSLDHVALWTSDRDAVASLFTECCGMHEIERTDAFTLVGGDAREGKVTLFEAEGPRERGVLERIVLRVPALDDVRDRLENAGHEVRNGDRELVVEAPPGVPVGIVESDSSPVPDLDRVVLRVPDPGATAVALAGLGLERRGENVGVAGRDVELRRGDPSEGESPLLNHLAFLVDASDAVEQEARERGLEVDDVVDAPNTRAVFLVGPDRIRLEYVEHKPGFSLT
jgi:catechol 2,3-dioxygenase-like lactoylglutathione lyase family enzyme